MRYVFNRVVATIRSRARQATSSTVEAQCAQLVEALDVERLGRREGVRNLPPPGADADPNEVLIEQRFRALLTQVTRASEATLRAALDRLSAQAERFSPAGIMALPAAARDGLAQIDARWREVLREARDAEREAHRELDAFRHEHQLTYGARPARPLADIALFAACAAVLEGLLNSWAFSTAAVGGWREALLTATVVAAINVAAGIAAGLAGRNVFHRNRWRKAAGAAALLLYGWFALEFTAGTARYRTALVLDPDSAATVPVEQIGQMAFAIGDFNTALLVLASLGFAAASFAAGFFSKDRYPGYSEIADTWRERDRMLRALRCDHFTEATRLTDSVLDEVDQRLRAAAQARREYERVARHARDIVNADRHDRSVVDSQFRHAIQRYRSALLAVREPGVPVPTFMRPECPVASITDECPALDPTEVQKAETAVQGFGNAAAELEAAATRARQDLVQIRAQCRAGSDDLSDASGAERGPIGAPPATATPGQAKSGRPRTNGGDLGLGAAH